LSSCLACLSAVVLDNLAVCTLHTKLKSRRFCEKVCADLILCLCTTCACRSCRLCHMVFMTKRCAAFWCKTATRHTVSLWQGVCKWQWCVGQTTKCTAQQITRANAPSRGGTLASSGMKLLCWQPAGCATYNRPTMTDSNCTADDKQPNPHLLMNSLPSADRAGLAGK